MKLTVMLSFLLVVCLYSTFRNGIDKDRVGIKANHVASVRDSGLSSRLKSYAEAAATFAAGKYNEHIVFLADMRIPPGKNRFFVYDRKNDSVLISGLVTHGSGSESPSGNLVFSDIANSHATSLGKYRVSQKYNGKFGLAFKLEGLERSNRNAYARFVVLHAHPLVPPKEVYPEKICTSWGCPTVNPAFLTELEGYISRSFRPILLWIYY